MTLEGQAGNIGATAFAVSNIETQKQIVQKRKTLNYYFNNDNFILV